MDAKLKYFQFMEK